jgi:hypothetical protein
MEDNIQTESAYQKKDRLYSRISFWTSVILSIAITGYYFITNPPPEGAERRMKMFIAKNAKDVTEFLRMTRDEQKTFAERKKHPFYTNYNKASENIKLDIRGQVHNSVDFKPAQYWFNLAFLWAIFFATVWFIGLMSQAAIQINRNKDIERKAEKMKQKDS